MHNRFPYNGASIIRKKLLANGLRATAVKSKFSTNNFKKIRIPQFSETRFGSFVGLFLCFDVYKQ